MVIRRQETPLGRVTEEKLRCVRIPLLRKNNRVKNTEKSATYHQRNPFREDLKKNDASGIRSRTMNYGVS